MESDLQRRVQRYGWDRAAIYYENFWQRQLKPAQDKLLEMARLQPGEKIIDIACGTGLVSFPAAEKIGKNGFVLATDISDNMVKIGNESAKEKNYKNMRFERMDAEELSVCDEEYDVALCALGLMYVPDAIKALREMRRVIKPGGRAVAAVWGQRDHCGWAEIFEIVDRRVSSEVCPMFFNLGNRDVLKRSFEAAGFSNIVFERLNTELIYHSDEEACAAFTGNFQQGYILEHEKDIAKSEPGPHNGGGMSTGYSFFSQAKDFKMAFRKRVLHKGSAIGYHLQKEDEVYYIVSGEGEMKMNDKTFKVKAGDAILTRPGSLHGLQPIGNGDLVIIITYELNQ